MCSKGWFSESPKPPTILISCSASWLHKIPSQTLPLYSDILKQDSLTRGSYLPWNVWIYLWGCQMTWEVKCVSSGSASLLPDAGEGDLGTGLRSFGCRWHRRVAGYRDRWAEGSLWKLRAAPFSRVTGGELGSTQFLVFSSQYICSLLKHNNQISLHTCYLLFCHCPSTIPRSSVGEVNYKLTPSDTCSHRKLISESGAHWCWSASVSAILSFAINFMRHLAVTWVEQNCL